MTVVTHILPACSVPGFPGEPVLAHLARSSCMWLPHVSACDGHSQHPFFVKEFGHCRHFILVNRQTHLTDLHWSQDSRDNCHHSQTAFLLLVFSFFHCYLFIYKHICQIRSRNSQRLKAFPMISEVLDVDQRGRIQKLVSSYYTPVTVQGVSSWLLSWNNHLTCDH